MLKWSDKVYKLLLNVKLICQKLKTHVKKNLFYHYALVGKNLCVGINSACINLSGKKESIKIGDEVTILGKLVCAEKGRIYIGNYTRIGPNSEIGAAESIYIGNYVIISHDIYIYDNNNHSTDPDERILLSKSKFDKYHNSWYRSKISPVVIEDNVWIGMNSIILKGVTIGKGSIVAAGSVVTKSIPPYSIVAGNPARIVKKLRS